MRDPPYALQCHTDAPIDEGSTRMHMICLCGHTHTHTHTRHPFIAQQTRHTQDIKSNQNTHSDKTPERSLPLGTFRLHSVSAGLFLSHAYAPASHTQTQTLKLSLSHVTLQTLYDAKEPTQNRHSSPNDNTDGTARATHNITNKQHTCPL